MWSVVIMRPAVLSVIFALLAQRGSGDNDFRPTPIPLGEWHQVGHSEWEGRSYSSEVSRPAVIPAHYWEDALRHSVYLTLVRDKIDQLIAKGDVISPESKPDHYVSKDIDDHDLWEKIKTAPFERIKEEEPSSFGDVTIMAKGRLVDDRGRFRFTEDERSTEKCNEESCMDNVKAFWSVKRVRQRDSETSGKYNYELTFSVSSHHAKKQQKPYENPVRTFTVKETSPDQALDMPQEHRSIPRPPVPPSQVYRPSRALWVHKNISPISQSRQHHTTGLDRLFSSLFSDDDDYEPPKYRPNPYHPPGPYQYSKVGYVGSPTDQQKRLTPYPYKPVNSPYSYKYSRPIPPPPYQHAQHHYQESDSISHPYATPPDHRYLPPPGKPLKTTRPAQLPTSPSPVTQPKNWTVSETDTSKPNETEISTIAPEKNQPPKTYTKPRPMSMKINYFPDHVRPPIYNAPPGVFVTMDKKPFKPMPPLKLVSKPIKHHKPIDFRPSPQVLDMQQFSDPDPLRDSAFRPILPVSWDISANSSSTTTEKIEVAETTTTQNNNTRKVRPKGKKPPKKHENIKVTHTTTSAPEIITASSDSGEESDAMQWANVVGAFSRTTPMASQKGKPEIHETTTSSTTSTTVTTTTPVRRKTTTTEAFEETTTAKPKPRRTRPPPKFAKQDKFKKHKRITTTTTKAPEVTKTSQDLTPQASSAVSPKPTWSPENKVQTSTTTSTTTTTTTRRPTTTTRITTTTPEYSTSETRFTSSTTQPKINKNRYRQSTLLQKGTSLNHDKWSVHTESMDKTKPTVPTDSAKIPPRRKGSNFQGYVSSTTPRSEERYEKYHEDQVPMKSLTVQPLSTTPEYEETADQYENNGETSDYDGNKFGDYNDDTNEEQESRDHTEYIFQTTTPNERTNEVDDELITTEQIITSPVSVTKNKTKCKKKKPQDSTIIEKVGEAYSTETSSTTTTTTTTTPEPSTPSIFEEIFGSFTADSETKDKPTEKPDLQEQESERHGHFVKLDDDLKDFLDSLEAKHVDGEEDYGDDDSEIDEDSSFNSDEDSPSARDSPDDDDDEYHERPYSLLELMAMD